MFREKSGGSGRMNATEYRQKRKQNSKENSSKKAIVQKNLQRILADRPPQSPASVVPSTEATRCYDELFSIEKL